MLKRVSASQVQTFTLCNRKWFIESVLKERAPESEAMKAGTEVHTETESYLLTGVIRDTQWAPYVTAAAPYLPPAPVPPTVFIERWIEQPTYTNGPLWVGKIDVLDASGDVIDILDHKTSKKSRHHLDEEGLKKSVQLAAYAKYALTVTDFADKNRSRVTLTHNNIKIEGKPKVVQVRTEATADEVEETWQGSLAQVRSMERVHQLPTWKEVEPNTSACNSYGGCPFRERCGFTTVIDQLLGGKSMSSNLLDRLKKLKGIPETTDENVQDVGALVADDVAAMSIVPPDAPSRTNTPTPKCDAALERLAQDKEAVEVKKTRAKKEKPETPPMYIQDSGGAFAKVKEKVDVTTSPEPTSFEIYQDCMPIIGADQPVPFEVVIAPLMKQVAEEAGVAHLGFLKYGEGKHRLAELIARNADTFPKRIFVAGMSSYSDVFLEVVVPLATLYMRATRG